MSDFAIRINTNDNIALALAQIPAGADVFGTQALSDIPAGHKMALCAIPAGSQVRKYGFAIGVASADIPAGAHIHTHNLATQLRGVAEYAYNPTVLPLQGTPPQETFFGFKRPCGRVGVRNEVWIIPTVGCVNETARRIAAAAWTDDVHAYAHPLGCSQLGADHKATQAVLAGLVRHPNAAGVLVLGLGCENNHIAAFKEHLGDYDPQRVKFLNVQDVADEVTHGARLVNELSEYAAKFVRSEVSMSSLVVGLKCGGSCGLSGITANALVGRFCDMLVMQGGSALLTEVPEMFGAEDMLLNRAKDADVFARAAGMINAFKQYYIDHDQPVYENPSPGNKDGGITTLEEKSLGCTIKGGNHAVVDVLAYAEQVRAPGLSLLEGPGNDIVAVTNLAAAGAHIVLFTTGRGTPLGGPVPVIKISSNSTLFANKPHWIDYDAGALADTDGRRRSMEIAQRQLFKLVAGVADGTRTKSEDGNYRDIAIFKNGVTL